MANQETLFSVSFEKKIMKVICIAEVEHKMFASESEMYKIYIYIYEDIRNDFAEVLSTCDNSWNFVFKWVICLGAQPILVHYVLWFTYRNAQKNTLAILSMKVNMLELFLIVISIFHCTNIQLTYTKIGLYMCFNIQCCSK